MLRSTYLVQRLNPPRGAGNPFSFGGGYKNGGLSDEAMGLINGVFSFDYMGAAEYEFGEVPKALGVIAKQAEEGVLEAFEFSILNSKVAPPWRAEANPPAPRSRSTIYVICHRDWRPEVEGVIAALASKNAPRLKMPASLPLALRPGVDDGWFRTCGWLELDNGFMFFTDREMWAKTAALFGVEVPEEVAA